MHNNLSYTPKYWAIVPAAGSGKRFGGTTPKQYLFINNKTVMQYSIDTLCLHLPLSKCIVVIAKDDTLAQSLFYRESAQLDFVTGGSERMDSVLAGLNALSTQADANDWVLVHDVARPCIAPESLQQLLLVLHDSLTGGVLAVPVRDTLKQGNASHHVVKTVSREHLWQVQTPQMFRYGLLLSALEQAKQAGVLVTDEASAMELAGHAVQLVTGRMDNIKVTYADDLPFAEMILRAQMQK